MDFPKEVFVKIEADGDTEFLLASETLAEQAEIDGTIRVAKYKLVEIGKVRAIPTFTPNK
jgi:hypothetical protein